MLVSFGVFCIICVIIGLGLNFFLYRSVVPMPTVLVVGRGTVGVTGPDQIETVVRDQRELFNSVVISTDGQSQSTLSFRDHVGDGGLVAALTVKKNTTFDLGSVSRPRFNFSDGGYEIQLDNLTGALDIFIPTGLERPVRLDLYTAAGIRVIITGAGQYSVRATPDNVLVDNLDGQIALVVPDGRALAIPAGQRGIWYVETTAFALTTSYVNLLANASFEQTNLAQTITPGGGILPRELPLMWGCADQPNNPPAGDYGVARLDGRASLHLRRSEGASSHGETFCVQSFAPPGTPGHDVTGYDYLSLRTTFKLVGHSLSACGVAGSECPLMLQITYLDAAGEQQNWYHGFYAHVDPALAYPLSCSSCRQEHDIVNLNTWYTYESENLFAALPAAEHPYTIQEVRVYASGHEYDVYLSQVSLLAGDAALPAPAEALGG